MKSALKKRSSSTFLLEVEESNAAAKPALAKLLERRQIGVLSIHRALQLMLPTARRVSQEVVDKQAPFVHLVGELCTHRQFQTPPSLFATYYTISTRE